MPEPAARRRKMVALVLSGIFPGLGQLYNRQPFKGAVFVALGLVLSWLTGRAVPTDPQALARPGAAGVERRSGARPGKDRSLRFAHSMKQSTAVATSGTPVGFATSIQTSFPRNTALAPPSALDAA